MVVDDELLQELLAKASGLYNGGEYRAAIDAWKEALAVDPSSQKAQEGIQMATLLLGDWEPAATVTEAPASPAAAPADGAPAVPHDLTPDQIAKRLEEGATRVRTLLRQRRYSEAVEGARSLVPIDPDSEEVQHLLEEAQQAFEAAPFIEEHLTLARELAQQERLEEAEAECKKVFSLDPTNPDGHVLLMELRTRRANEARSPAASRRDAPVPGGMTMRIDATQLRGIQRPPAAKPEPVAKGGAVAKPAPGAAPDPSEEMTPAPDAADEPAAGVPGPAAAPAAAEALPDELFDFDPALLDEKAPTGRADAVPLAEPAADDAMLIDGAQSGEAAADAGDAAAGGDDVHVPGEPEDTYVDAATVVPPAVRLVDRKSDSGPTVESLLESLDDAGEIPPGPAVKPAAPTKKNASPPAKGAPVAPGSWEQELTDLNRKTGQHEIVGRRAAKAPSRKAESDTDVDLSALLGDDLGDAAAPSHQSEPGSGAAEEADPAIPLDLPEPDSGTGEAAASDAAGGASTELGADADAQAEPSMPPPEGRSRANLPIYFALLGVFILVIGAGVWWFFLQPRSASGQVPPASAAPPPSSRGGTASSADALPTPMGSTSRQSAQPHPAAMGAAPAGTSAPGAGTPAPGGQAPAPSQPAAASAAPVPQGPRSASPPPAATAPPVGRGGAATAAAPVQAAQGTAPATPAAAAPAPAAPRSVEEVRREAAAHMAEGKRLMALEKWQEAHAEFATVLALDPMSFESRELLDKTQVRIDQDLKVRKDLDEARRAFDDKDYQQALWKLYRLPHDPRLGDVDLRIRNAWFDWAVMSLKGGDAVDAKQKLTEVLQADPDDADAKRLMEVAERYSARPKDRTFYAFIDTLRPRAFDQK